MALDQASSFSPSPGEATRSSVIDLLKSPRAYMRAWFYSRLPRTDVLELTQRNVYIVPTRAGWMLAATLVVLLIASINYQLNLGYLLTFLIAGSAAAGMYGAHGNLRGLRLHLQAPRPTHADQLARLTVRLDNPDRKNRYGISVTLADDAQTQDSASAVADAMGGSGEQIGLAWHPPGRGLHHLPALRAQTLFPLGAFRVWTIWRPAARLLVYPAPELNPPPLPNGRSDSGELGQSRPTGVGDYDGVRAYRRGDPPRAIVWRKAATAISAGRSDLVSRDTSGSSAHQLWLDMDTCGLRNTEACISRLTAWALLAERLELDYGLRLGGQEIPPSHGSEHLHHCLEVLALC